MKKVNRYLIVLLLVFTYGCEDNVKFEDKELIIKGTTNKIIVQVPKKCQQFSSTILESVEFLKKSAKSDQSLKKIYDKAELISEFSENIKAITIAQCEINRKSNVYDPNISDQAFYSELVKSYVEFQMWKDLKTANNSVLLDSAINRVYNNIYEHKNEELSNLVNDMAFSFKTAAGSTVVIYVNGQMACATVADATGEVTCVVPKKYLLPRPKEISFVKIVATAIGFEPKQLNYSMGEAMLQVRGGKRINLN